MSLCIMNDIMIIISVFKALCLRAFFFPLWKLNSLLRLHAHWDDWQLMKTYKAPTNNLISIQNKNVLTPHAYNKNIFIMILFTQINQLCHWGTANSNVTCWDFRTRLRFTIKAARVTEVHSSRPITKLTRPKEVSVKGTTVSCKSYTRKDSSNFLRRKDDPRRLSITWYLSPTQTQVKPIPWEAYLSLHHSLF